MNVRATLTAVLLATIGVSAGSVMAKEVSDKGHSRTDVKDSCGGTGDVYWVPGKTGHTYGCFYADGSGIVCSGASPKQKHTCTQFRTGSVPPPKIPTRDELIKKLEASEQKKDEAPEK